MDCNIATIKANSHFCQTLGMSFYYRLKDILSFGRTFKKVAD